MYLITINDNYPACTRTSLEARSRFTRTKASSDRRVILFHSPPDNWSGRVELAALLTSRVSELAIEVLIRRTQEVRELKIFIAQPVLGEVDNEVAELLVRDRGLTNFACKVNVLNHALKGCVGLLQGPKCLVKAVSNVVVDLVKEIAPTRPSWDEKGFDVKVGAGCRSSASPSVLPLISSKATTFWRSSSNWSEHRLRNSIPKMYSLNSEASIFPRRMSAAA